MKASRIGCLLVGLSVSSGCSNVAEKQATVSIEDETSSDVQSALVRATRHANEQGLVQEGAAVSLRGALFDSSGQEHVRLERKERGLRVYGGDMVVHSDRNGRFDSVSRSLEQSLGAFRLTPFKGQVDALSAAVSAFQGTVEGDQTVELVINAHERAPVLAYEVIVKGTGLEGQESVMHTLVNAMTGEVDESWDENQTVAAQGSGKGLYSGTVSLTTDSAAGSFALRDPSRGNQKTVNMRNGTSGSGTQFTDADNVWGSGLNSDPASAAVDAQYGTTVTWDYYKNVHGRSGIANDGRGSTNRVHYGRNYNNAFWSDGCFCMTYGDGDGTRFNPLVSLDVAGHEMTHGVISRTANLIYSRESGGLNEGTADIFGSMVEYAANNASDPGDYLIGEKLAVNNPTGTSAFRYMHDPTLDTRSIGCYVSTAGSLDVHFSSGIANHFYFLLAEGSNGALKSPTCNNSTIAGIGRSAAEKIWYRALTVYMTSSTNYKAARTATLNAARDLFGAASTQQNAVAAAWSAVNVN
jgi:zinc metalloprotease ZmpA